MYFNFFLRVDFYLELVPKPNASCLSVLLTLPVVGVSPKNSERLATGTPLISGKAMRLPFGKVWFSVLCGVVEARSAAIFPVLLINPTVALPILESNEAD